MCTAARNPASARQSVRANQTWVRETRRALHCSQKIRSRRDRCFQNNRILSSLRRANSTPTGGIWVVRPDGYVTLAAKHDAWNEVEAYLSHLARAATA